MDESKATEPKNIETPGEQPAAVAASAADTPVSAQPAPVAEPSVSETATSATSTSEPLASEMHASAAHASETSTELASIESPPLAPTIPAGGLPSTEVAPVEELTWTVFDHNGGAPLEFTDEDEPAPEHPATKFAMPRLSRTTALAASVVLAAALGAVAGVYGASNLMHVGREAPPAAEVPQSLRATLTQMRTDIAALKSSIDATSRNATTQFAKLADRFDKIERAQTDIGVKSSKAVESLDRLDRRMDPAPATTGSVTPQLAAAPAVTPPTPPAPPAVSGWVLRDVYRGAAILQGRMGSLIEVEPGDVLPGVGRIEAIRRQEGRWVVVTSRGLITSMR